MKINVSETLVKRVIETRVGSRLLQTGFLSENLIHPDLPGQARCSLNIPVADLLTAAFIANGYFFVVPDLGQVLHSLKMRKK